MEVWLNYAAIYVALTYVMMLFRPSPKLREAWLAVSGVIVVYICFFYGGTSEQQSGFILTIVLSLWFYLMLVVYRDFPNTLTAIAAIGGPMFLLAFAKLGHINVIVGFSYLTFRVAYLAYEIHTGRTKLPGFIRYVGFVFFPLTFLIGPISPYRYYSESLDTPQPPLHSRCLSRILVGILKCYIFAQLFKTMSFSSYWLPYYQHNFSDFTISCICTTLYIYFNFSGACDMMIGAAALLGIRVQENFNNPFFSRNLAEYWTRNHITLAQVVRDIIFTPSVLMCARATRGRYMLAITSALSMVAFLIVGVWHGNQMGFALFGLAHGAGVVLVNLYGVILRYLPARFQHFTATRSGRALSVFVTFMFVAYTSVFFSNDSAQLALIWQKLVF